MCVIQGKPSTRYRISNTEIFVAPTVDNNQWTVYANRVNKKKKMKKKKGDVEGEQEDGAKREQPTEAMILPVVSYDKGKDIQLVDLTTMGKMFEEMDTIFRPPKINWAEIVTFIMCGCCLLGGETEVPPLPLKVHRVGSYQVSVVPSKEDFELLDKDVFMLDSNVAKLFSDKYSTDFAFVVCKLVNNGATYHPIGYISPRLRDEGALFIPTYHFHGKPDDKKADWDHAIYTAFVNGVPTHRDGSGMKGIVTKRRYGPGLSMLNKLFEWDERGQPLLDSVRLDLDSIQGLNLTRIKSKSFIGSYHHNHDLYVTS
eukprot:TRINITY_DN1628_c0_g2_i1.p2 TRINITY_DN1628_c0_g2~~TRINITY_DN1628_c0_g2_i1.p2  ORF type:complete len:313 (-),score=74.98 TRINITY_DN1628_c0_g2_i1:1881-2819(-)